MQLLQHRVMHAMSKHNEHSCCKQLLQERLLLKSVPGMLPVPVSCCWHHSVCTASFAHHSSSCRPMAHAPLSLCTFCELMDYMQPSNNKPSCSLLLEASVRCIAQMSVRDEDTLPLSLPPRQRDSISRVSAEPIESAPAPQVHRDDSARISKGVNSIVT